MSLIDQETWHFVNRAGQRWVVQVMAEARTLVAARLEVVVRAIIASGREAFGWSIDLDRVKVTNARYAADFIQAVKGGRPFTTMYVLNFSSKMLAHAARGPALAI